MPHCRASMQGLSLTPHGKNVLGGVDIPIMPDATFRTGPLAHVQWQRVEHLPAVVTAFGTLALGYQRSIVARVRPVRPYQFALYSTWRTRSPRPTSLMALASV